MSSSSRDDDELTGKRRYARECIDFVRVCGVRRLASLIAVCMEWDPTPIDELTEELRQQFLKLWERADHIEVIILFLSFIENLKHLPSIGGISEAGGGIQVETLSDNLYDSLMASVSVKVQASIYHSIKCIVNSTPAAKDFSLSKEDLFMELVEELGGVSAVAEDILHVPGGAYGVVDLIPCMITCIARKGLVQEAVPKFVYAAGIRRMRDISLETFELEHVMARVTAVAVGNPPKSKLPLPQMVAQVVVMCVDLVLGLLIVVWLVGKAFFRHLGDL